MIYFCVGLKKLREMKCAITSVYSGKLNTTDLKKVDFVLNHWDEAIQLMEEASSNMKTGFEIISI